MAIEKISLTSTNWTLIGNNVTTITYQNISQFPMYINFTASNTAPTSNVGLIYDLYQGELKKDVTALTYTTTPNYVWARAISSNSATIVEVS